MGRTCTPTSLHPPLTAPTRHRPTQLSYSCTPLPGDVRTNLGVKCGHRTSTAARSSSSKAPPRAADSWRWRWTRRGPLAPSRRGASASIFVAEVSLGGGDVVFFFWEVARPTAVRIFFVEPARPAVVPGACFFFGGRRRRAPFFAVGSWVAPRTHEGRWRLTRIASKKCRQRAQKMRSNRMHDGQVLSRHPFFGVDLLVLTLLTAHTSLCAHTSLGRVNILKKKRV